MVQNRVVFGQLLQADAISVCRIDACRVGGVNEVLAVLLLASHPCRRETLLGPLILHVKRRHRPPKYYGFSR